jgi:hypothetical protein
MRIADTKPIDKDATFLPPAGNVRTHFNAWMGSNSNVMPALQCLQALIVFSVIKVIH